ncbi:MAG TPA: response regulator [Chitinophagaceae bacterium]|jgi:CheY-like chemotaxis protein|nr:response regulator [Chitinophagaceae bacterium]
MKRKILAIDESKAIRFLLQTVLGQKHQVITAADGCSALYWLSKRNLPDVIIIDPQLPDMQNWELLEHLKSSGLYGHIPIIVLSSLDAKETQQRCKELGITRSFQQPFNPVELEGAIEELLKYENNNAGTVLRAV